MPVPSTPFFAEYSFNISDQVILNIVNPDPVNTASGYNLVVYLYNPDTQTASNYTAPIQAIGPHFNYLIIDPEFYDLFDVTTLAYYNDEQEFGGIGVAASPNVRTVGRAISAFSYPWKRRIRRSCQSSVISCQVTLRAALAAFTDD